MRPSVKPFYFYTSQPLVELTGLKARNLKELWQGVKEVDGSSIYFHTHHYVREHHFLSNEYPSDFAYWVAEILQERVLGEKLAILDVRSFATIRELREKILSEIEEQLENSGRVYEVPAGLEFHFRKTLSIIVPTGHRARTLAEFNACLRKVDLNSIYFHLVEYGLREENITNDFSQWIRDGFQDEALASAIERINPYRQPLEECRLRIVELLSRQEKKQRLFSQLASYPSSGIVDSLKEKTWFRELKSRFQKIW